MSARSLLLVSKRFWPLAGPEELLAAGLAEQISNSGWTVEVVTSHFVRQWPDQFQMGSVSVHRVPRSQRSWSPATLGYYGRNRWLRGLQRWLGTHRSRIEAAIVLESGTELATAQAVARAGIPALVRIGNDVLDQISPADKALQALTDINALLVTPDPSRKRDNALTPIDGAVSMEYVPDGIPDLPADMSDRNQAREILARTHPIFHLDKDALLAVSGAALTFDSGVFALVRAWRRVLAAHPSARLWLIGSGENAPELFQRICDLEMQHSVLIPGNFDDVTDLFQAADVLVLPGIGDHADWYLNTALGHRVTIIHHQRAPVVADLPSTAHHIPFDDDSRSIDLVVNRWANAAASQTENGSGRIQRSGQQPPDTQSIARMANRYLELIAQMVTGNQAANR